MRATVVIEHRYERTPDGAVWTPTFFGYSFWQRYLEVFDEVKVIARVRDATALPANWKRADGERVTFAPVPYYVGPWQYLRKMRQVDHTVRAALGPEDALILRLDSQLAASLEPLLYKTGRPFGAEVVVDPYDVFAPGSVRHALRAFFRWWFARKLREQCRRAAAVAYVTETALQRRYPPSPGAMTTHYSSVELPPAAYAEEPRRYADLRGKITLITVSLLDQLRKCPDKLVAAVRALLDQGMDPRLVIVGDGKHRPELETLAANLGVGERVRFAGQLPGGDAVRARLDQADVFVLASHGEGLPRAALEAMARGLPVIGSTIAGYREILPPEDLVPPGDLNALVAKVREIAASPERMTRMSARSLERSRDYREELLRPRRAAFYASVRAKTEEWLQCSRRVRMAVVNTEADSWESWKGHVAYMRAHGIEYHCISSGGPLLDEFAASEGAVVHAVEVSRTITPWRDLRTVVELARKFRGIGVEIVEGETSKGGLLAMVAAWLARVPARVYHNHGMALSSAAGPVWLLLWWCERIACLLAHEVIYVSPSVRNDAVVKGVCPPDKAKVVLSGKGVEAAHRFNPANLEPGARDRTRQRYGIPAGALVLGFVGRLFRVKGIIELADAWKTLAARYPNLHLLAGGEFDTRDPVPEPVARQLREDARVHLTGYIDDTPPLFAAMDLLILPSFYEGLGNVLIEASAMEVPVIGTRIPGIVDAIREGVTGTLIEPGSVPQIVESVRRYLDDPELRRRHGQAGRQYVLENFSPERVWAGLHERYTELLRRKGLRTPIW